MRLTRQRPAECGFTRVRIITGAALALAALALLTACSGPEGEFEPPRVVESTYHETGDLKAIEARGYLRLLLVRRSGGDGPLPPAGLPVHGQLRVAAGFARSVGLTPLIVLVERFDDLVPALQDGRGDVIVANLPITPEPYREIGFTVALDRTRQVLVKRKGDPLNIRAGLTGRTITVERGTRFWDTARRLQDTRPALRIEGRPDLSVPRKVELLLAREIDLTLIEGNTLNAILPDIAGIAAAFPVSQGNGIGLGLRANADALKTAFDRYITRRQLTRFESERHTGDLPAIKRRGVLRVATRNSAANYFLWRGRQRGFEYELARRFAQQLGLRIEVVVGESDRELLAMLREGRADLAAAFLSKALRGTDADEDGIAWSRPYHFATKQVVTDADDDALRRITDLNGRTFRVREDSDEWRIARALRVEGGLDIAIRDVPPDESIFTSLAKVADGRYDLTITDDHVVGNAVAWNDRVRAAFTLGKPIADRWVVRADNPKLLAAANAFLEEVYRSEFYNVTYTQYFSDRDSIRRHRTYRLDFPGADQLSPWDDLVQHYAGKYGFDWRLVTAQLYQESTFNAEARSWAGAVGLMQILPRTAGQVGITGDLTDPQVNLRAALRYLDWVRARFEQGLSVENRVWFTLAAYNAGIGHVRDARRLAERLGLDPDRWFDHVERAMLLLSNPRYYQNTRFGYVRGAEPVEYVRDIRDRYQAYLRWTDDCWPSCKSSPKTPMVEHYAPPA